MLGTILIVILILLLIGALPTWPYSSGWGYYPGGGTRRHSDHRPCAGFSWTHLVARPHRRLQAYDNSITLIGAAYLQRKIAPVRPRLFPKQR